MPVPCPQCKTEIPEYVPTVGSVIYECPSCGKQTTGEQLLALRVAANKDDAYEPDAPPLMIDEYNAVSMPAPFMGIASMVIEEPDPSTYEAEAPRTAKKASAKKK